MSKKIYIAGIENDSITDGPGLRMTIFMQGCDKNCPGCHNESAKSMTGGEEFSSGELIEKMKNNPLITGVTFSGGEPLLQAEALVPVAKWIKENHMDLTIYTGSTLEAIFTDNDKSTLELLQYTDILIDGPYIDEERSLSLSFRGSSNQRILDMQASLEKKSPAITDDERWY